MRGPAVVISVRLDGLVPVHSDLVHVLAIPEMCLNVVGAAETRGFPEKAVHLAFEVKGARRTV